MSLRPQVLVIDDDPGQRRALHLLLQGGGFDVCACAAPDDTFCGGHLAGSACLVAAHERANGTGIDVLATLRARGWDGPAILIAIGPSAQLHAATRDAGFSQCLARPFNDHALVNAVRRAIG